MLNRFACQRLLWGFSGWGTAGGGGVRNTVMPSRTCTLTTSSSTLEHWTNTLPYPHSSCFALPPGGETLCEADEMLVLSAKLSFVDIS